MFSDQELHHWVSDKLHEALGMSDKVVVDFLITTARKTHNVADFTSKLSTVLDGDGDMSKVAQEIWSNVPRKSKAGENVNRIKERAAVQQQQINASFKMLLSDDDDDPSDVPVTKQKKSKKKKKKKKSSSDEDDDDGSGDGGESTSKKIKYRKKKSKKETDEESDGEEQRRIEDLKVSSYGQLLITFVSLARFCTRW